jgi:hypothetical protein
MSNENQILIGLFATTIITYLFFKVLEVSERARAHKRDVILRIERLEYKDKRLEELLDQHKVEHRNLFNRI